MADNRRPRRSRRILRALRWPLFVLGGLLLLIVGTAVIVPLVLPSDQVEALVVPRLEAALDREVEVETAGVRVLPLPALRLHDFKVANADGFGPEPAIEGSALDVRLELLPLFRGDVRFRSIELDAPVIRYVVDAEGRHNFEGLGGAEEAPQDAPPAGALPLAAAFSSVRANDASLSYVNRQSNRSAAVAFDMTTEVDPLPDTDDLQSRGTVDLHSGWTLPPDSEDTLSVRDARLEYDLLAEPDAERIAVNRLTLDAAALRAEASGAITNLETEPTVDLRIESDDIDLARLATLQGGASDDAEAPSGDLRFDLLIAGPAMQPDRLTVDGPVTLSEVRYPVESFREPVYVPSAELRFAGQQLTADAIPIRLGEDALELDLEVQDLFAPFSAEEETEMPPLPEARFALTSERLDLTTLYAETDDVGYSDLLLAQLAGRQIEGQDPSALAAEAYGDLVFLPAEVQGQVAIDALISSSSQYDDVSFQVALTPQQLAVRDISATMYGGTATGEASVDLQQQEPLFPAEYAFALEGSTAEAFVQQWTTLGTFLSGTLDFSLTGRSAFGADLLPAPRSIEGEGSAIAIDGDLQDLALLEAVLEQLQIETEALTFERFGGPFEIREGQLLVPGWTLQADDFSGELEGTLGLSGEVDLDLVLTMPLALLQESGLVDRVGGAPARLLGRFVDEGETVRVPLELGGTMSAPRVRVDTETLAVSLRQLIRQAAE